MTDVILYYPKTGLDTLVQIPQSVLFVASTLQDYDLMIIDERIDNDAHKKLEKKSSDILCVGISSMTGSQILNALKASKIAHKSTKIVWGGIHPTIKPIQTLANKYIDFIVRGEGEITFFCLLKCIENSSNLDEINGIGYKHNNCILINTERKFLDMNKLPDLPYDLLDMNKYIATRDGFKKCLTLQTSRGCPHNCGFCFNSIYNKRRWRGLTANIIVDRTESLIKQYNLDGIIYQEDNFFANMNRFKEYCDIVYERNLDICWKTNCRVDYLINKDDSFFKMLSESGCKVLQFGIESGSDRILKMLNKGITVNDILYVNKKLTKYNIKCKYNFMIGLPTETANEINTTINFIDKLKKENRNLESCFLNIYVPWPGTELYNLSIEEGFRPPNELEDWASFNWNTIKMPWIDSSRVNLIEQLSTKYLNENPYFRNN